MVFPFAARVEEYQRGPVRQGARVTVLAVTFLDVKANVLLTHFGKLKWTHPHGGERESVFRHSECATALICSAMAAQHVPCEEPGSKVAALLFALLTSGSSDGVKNAPMAFAKKTTSCFFTQEE